MGKKRAVAYVRVSTATTAQIHSFEFQEQYWNRKFADSANTELVGIYADKGISGCNIKRRQQFLAMMEAAREHKFDEIHTKSVSRFARNTVELLQCVRELRDLGIEVIFEKENIRTFDPASEVFLTIAASIAENDLQVDSERQRWSRDHRIKNGWIFAGSAIYGYNMTKDNELVIVPEEAEIVRRIYDMYISGVGVTTIAKSLNAEGHSTVRGRPWKPNNILGIIENEKYMGDTIMGKYVIVNGEQHKNSDGSFGKRYYIGESHEAIVSKEIWQKAQELRAERMNPKVTGQPIPVYPFTGIIECTQCHSHFRHKVNSSGKKWAAGIWACKTYLNDGVQACDNTRIKDSVLQEKFIEAYNEFITLRPEGDETVAMQKQISKLHVEERDLVTLAMKHLIPDATYKTEQKRIKAAIAALNEKISTQRSKFVHENDFEIITEFNPEKVEKFIKKVIVSKGTVAFVFYNGITISREYTNGQPGNKPGWNKLKEE